MAHADPIPLVEFQRSRNTIRSLSQDGAEKRIKIQQFGNELLNGLYRTQQRGIYSDFTLIVEGIKIHCHRIIIASFSSYFESLLSQNMREHDKKEITLRNLSGPMVKKLVDFAYSGEIIFTDDTVQELLETANFLDVKLVRQECAIYISKQIDSQNFIQIYELGFLIGEIVMTTSAQTYIIENFVMLSKTNEFKEIPLNLLVEILKTEKLKYVETNKVPTVFNQEESILNAVLIYVNYRKEERLPHLLKLLKTVRIGLLLTSFLNSLKQNELIKENEQILKLIDEAIEKGPLYKDKTDTTDVDTWRKLRKNDSLVEEWSSLFASGNEVYNRSNRNDSTSFDDSKLVCIQSALRRVKIYIRRWDGRPVVGGIETCYSCGTITCHGGTDFNPGEEYEFTLDEDEVIISVTIGSGFMIDRLMFKTNKNHTFGPYGGPGGSEQTVTHGGTEPLAGYLSCFKGKVVKAQELLGITHLAIKWIRHYTGDSVNLEHVPHHHNEFYFTDSETDNNFGDDDDEDNYSDGSEEMGI